MAAVAERVQAKERLCRRAPIFASCSVTRASCSSARAICSRTCESCSSARATKTSLVDFGSGVESISVSLSVQCDAKMGARNSFSCRTRVSIGRYKLSSQAWRCSQPSSRSAGPRLLSRPIPAIGRIGAATLRYIRMPLARIASASSAAGPLKVFPGRAERTRRCRDPGDHGPLGISARPAGIRSPAKIETRVRRAPQLAGRSNCRSRTRCAKDDRSAQVRRERFRG